MKALFWISVLMGLSSCLQNLDIKKRRHEGASRPEQLRPSPEKKKEPLSYSLVLDLASKAVEKKFSYLKDLPMKDVQDFCPRFSELSAYEKDLFFAHLISSMSKYESDFRPWVEFNENSGNISRGLLGISKRSISSKMKKYGCYVIKTADDLYHPEKNIRCALAILENYIRKSRYLAFQKKVNGKKKYYGGALYWAALREPYRVYLSYYDKSVTIGSKRKIISLIKKKFRECY